MDKINSLSKDLKQNIINMSENEEIQNESDYKSTVAKSKPMLSKKQRIKRVNWCKKYRSYTSEDWQKVIFSDESLFVVPVGEFGRVWRKKDEAFKRECVRPKVRHPGSIMI